MMQQNRRPLDEGSPTPDPDTVNPDAPSKSQRKRDADAVRELGAELAELSTAERQRVPLPEDVLAAVLELQSIRAHGARKRQLGFLAKRLRQIDLEPVHTALQAICQESRAQVRRHHQVEQWRDELLGLSSSSPDEALTRFIDTCPGVERQGLRQIQRQALQEQSAGKPPRAARELFRLVREALQAAEQP